MSLNIFNSMEVTMLSFTKSSPHTIKTNNAGKSFLQTLSFILLVMQISFTQDITNTLPAGGNFIVKDASNNYLTLEQSTGQMNILRTLQLENTTSPSVGVIFKGADRFIHNYGTNNIYQHFCFGRV